MVSNNKSSFMAAIVVAAAALLLLSSSHVEAFSPTRPSQAVVLSTVTQQRSNTNINIVGRMATTPLVVLQMTTDDDNEEENEVVGLPPLPSDAGKEQQSAPPPPPAAVSTTEVAATSSTNTASSSSTVEKEEEELQLQSYPIDLPSPILLATSMVLAISSIGSLFELSGGNPKLGLPITAVITALGLPLSVFLIYAAILKGAAETEEADREFTRVKRRL